MNKRCELILAAILHFKIGNCTRLRFGLRFILSANSWSEHSFTQINLGVISMKLLK
jgi:hypothetical protein